MLIKIIIIKMDTKNKKCMIKINIKMMTKIMIKMNGKIINYNMSNRAGLFMKLTLWEIKASDQA